MSETNSIVTCLLVDDHLKVKKKLFRYSIPSDSIIPQSGPNNILEFDGKLYEIKNVLYHTKVLEGKRVTFEPILYVKYICELDDTKDEHINDNEIPDNEQVNF